MANFFQLWEIMQQSGQPMQQAQTDSQMTGAQAAQLNMATQQSDMAKKAEEAKKQQQDQQTRAQMMKINQTIKGMPNLINQLPNPEQKSTMSTALTDFMKKINPVGAAH